MTIERGQQEYFFRFDFTRFNVKMIKKHVPSAYWSKAVNAWRCKRNPRTDEMARSFAKFFNIIIRDSSFLHDDSEKDYTIAPLPMLTEELMDQLPVLIKPQPKPWPLYGFDYQHHGIAYLGVRSAIVVLRRCERGFCGV